MIIDFIIIIHINMKKDNIPILFENKVDCCGCAACYSICPMGAITMNEDENGFEYPEINYSFCIKCRKCITVCPMKR